MNAPKLIATNALPKRLHDILCLDDFETAAEAHLPRPLFGYIAGAAESTTSLRDNRAAFDAWRFVPRIMVDVSQRNITQTLFDHEWSGALRHRSTGVCGASRTDGCLDL